MRWVSNASSSSTLEFVLIRIESRLRLSWKLKLKFGKLNTTHTQYLRMADRGQARRGSVAGHVENVDVIESVGNLPHSLAYDALNASEQEIVTVKPCDSSAHLHCLLADIVQFVLHLHHLVSAKNTWREHNGQRVGIHSVGRFLLRHSSQVKG